MVTTKDILDKYSRKIEKELDSGSSNRNTSAEYAQFKQDMYYEPSSYEKWAKSLGNIIKIKVGEKDRLKIQKYLNTSHADITPSQAITLSIISLLLIFFVTILISAAAYLITGSVPFLFFILGIIASMFVFYYSYSMPQRLANAWQLKASADMVPAVLYIVVYMKHTSNLERAIEFAAQHIEGPLSLDFKKVFYDVEIGRFQTIKQSLDNYLEIWKDYAPEFVESLHLVESSLYEPSESRRIEILEKSLQIILDGIYEKMLKYSREIRSPLTNIYMLGIILPTLGLALLPLASTLLQGLIGWPEVFVFFNIIVPFFVFYLVSEVLLKRPGGYGESSVLELNPDYEKFKSNKPWIKAACIAIPLIIIGLIPFIIQADFVTNLGIQKDYTFSQVGIPFTAFANANIFDFKSVNGNSIGPFGLAGTILSLFIPLGFALFFSIGYAKKTKDLIVSRENTKKLEEEFTNSIFQLGNRLGDGIPAEIAFSKVAEDTRGQTTQNFFSLVNLNIQQMGMSLDQAVFDKKRGAITFYPSNLIATSMKILVESVKKGLKVAARSLTSISEYVKNIQKINERLKDLLAEIVSDMKSNMTFLAPLLAGIVVGLSSMITLILNKLQGFQQTLNGTDVSSAAGGIGSLGSITQIFDLSSMIPPFFIQIIIGFYIIEIIYILTKALVTVDSGKDTLKEKYELARNIKKGFILYLATAFISTITLSLLAAIALSAIA